METEFKWNLSLDLSAKDLFGDELFRNLMIDDEVEVIEMKTSYYDTPDRYFANQNASLRLRDENGTGVWTIKIGAMSKNGLHQRQEWEMEVTDETEDRFDDKLFEAMVFLDEADGDGDPDDQMRNLLVHFPTEPIEEVAKLEFDRHRFDAGYGDSLLEISLDTGKVIRGDKSAPIQELEIELKEGNVQDLIDLAELIQERYRFEPEQRSKIARCMEL